MRRELINFLEKKGSSLEKLLVILLTFMSTLLMSSNSLTHFSSPKVISLENTVFLFLFYFLFNSKLFEYVKNKGNSFLTTSILTFFLILGLSVTVYGDARVLYKYMGVAFYVKLVFYFILIDFISYCLIDFLKNYQIKESLTFCDKYSQPTFIKIYFFIAICWIPFFVLAYPGSVTYDGLKQLNQFLGLLELTNHHPWLTTFFFGFLFKLGRTISDNFGIFLIVLCSSIYQCACYSFACSRLVKWSVPKPIVLFAVAYYALNPVFPNFAQSVVKDGLYVASLVLYFVSILEFVFKIREQQIPSYRDISLFFISALFVMLTRHEGVFLILISVLSLFCVIQNKKKYLNLLLVAVISISSFYTINSLILDKCEIQKGSVAEGLSIPFQQTARYFKYYASEVSTNEYQIVNRVLNAEKIGKLYDPVISDPVKNTFKLHSSSKDLKNYFEVWYYELRKHPHVYLDAFVAKTYGYFYPFAWTKMRRENYIYIQSNTKHLNTDKFNISYAFPQKVQNMLISYLKAFYNLPIFAQLLSPGLALWGLFFVFFNCQRIFYENDSRLIKAILFGLPLCIYVFCFLSPVNGYVRYAFPLYAIFPLLVGLLSSFSRKNGKLPKPVVVNLPESSKFLS